VLTERGLAYALTTLAERAPLEVVLDVRLDRRPPPAIEAAAYYVVAEALANVAKYAQATTATVSIDSDGERLHVEVGDDGVGGADASAGSGLRGLDDRVQAFGGWLRVNSPPGQGTRIPDAGAERLRVVVADDSVLLREGLKRILEDGGFDVVGQSGTAGDLMLKVRSYEPDLAIVDIRMPPTHSDEGLRAAQEIRERHPGTAVLVLSQYVESGYALELLADSAEGVGYLLKDRVSDVKDFAAAARRVAAGGTALDPEVVSRLVGRRKGTGPLDELSPREREVLELMAEGRSNHGIAERLVITERAVEKHITSIFGKLNLPSAPADHRRVLAVLAYLQS